MTNCVALWYDKHRELATECVSIGVDTVKRVRRRDAEEPCVGFLLWKPQPDYMHNRVQTEKIANYKAGAIFSMAPALRYVEGIIWKKIYCKQRVERL